MKKSKLLKNVGIILGAAKLPVPEVEVSEVEEEQVSETTEEPIEEAKEEDPLTRMLRTLSESSDENLAKKASDELETKAAEESEESKVKAEKSEAKAKESKPKKPETKAKKPEVETEEPEIDEDDAYMGDITIDPIGMSEELEDELGDLDHGQEEGSNSVEPIFAEKPDIQVFPEPPKASKPDEAKSGSKKPKASKPDEVKSGSKNPKSKASKPDEPKASSKKAPANPCPDPIMTVDGGFRGLELTPVGELQGDFQDAASSKMRPKKFYDERIGSFAYNFDATGKMAKELYEWISSTLIGHKALTKFVITALLPELLKDESFASLARQILVQAAENSMPYVACYRNKKLPDGKVFFAWEDAVASVEQLTNAYGIKPEEVFEVVYRKRIDEHTFVDVSEEEVQKFVDNFIGDSSALKDELIATPMAHTRSNLASSAPEEEDAKLT